MDAATIIKIVGAIAGVLFGTLIPTVILYVKKYKAWKTEKEKAAAAQTEAEKAAAEAEAEKLKNELLGAANDFVVAAEQTYKDVNDILKSRGNAGCGAVKKDSVMTKLQAACIEKGVEFDSEYWSAKVDELVKLTREVNAAKGA